MVLINSIIDIADSLINSVKNNPEFSGVEFLKAYDTASCNPKSDGIKAFVNIENTERKEGFVSGLYKTDTYGDVCSGEINVRLYGGNDITGESLTLACVRLKNAVINADYEGFISKSVISPVKYEYSTSAVYRELKFNIEYVLCEAIV